MSLSVSFKQNPNNNTIKGSICHDERWHIDPLIAFLLFLIYESLLA